MPLPSPFHHRTTQLNETQDWRSWSGYFAASLYEPSPEREYFAIRNSAALIDVSPLFKYEVVGPQAERLVGRVMTRDISKCRVGQVMYSPWCDEEGKVIDDGTIHRLADDHFRITAADPSLRWFQDVGVGLDAEVRDVSADLAALAVQGPLSRDLLKQAVTGVDLDGLRYYRWAYGEMNGRPLTISRTGFTGDLGYELWLNPKDAEPVWDALMAHGAAAYGALPAGMAALDMARIEAGLLLIEVDYVSTFHAVIPSQKSSPYEIGLDWAVKLDGADFIGKRALKAERQNPSNWRFVGVVVDWPDLERLFGAEDLPVQVAGRASRSAAPVYRNGRQVGQITSHTFSPILKKYIGLGMVEAAYAAVGTKLDVEFTVEYSREKAQAVTVKTPFFNPARKRGIEHWRTGV